MDPQLGVKSERLGRGLKDPDPNLCRCKAERKRKEVMDMTYSQRRARHYLAIAPPEDVNRIASGVNAIRLEICSEIHDKQMKRDANHLFDELIGRVLPRPIQG